MLPAKPQLRPLPESGRERGTLKVSGLATQLTSSPTKVIPTLPSETRQPLRTSPTAMAQASVSLKPSAQVAPLVVPALTPAVFSSQYEHSSLNPSTQQYSMEPDVDFPYHRFLTPSEL